MKKRFQNLRNATKKIRDFVILGWGVLVCFMVLVRGGWFDVIVILPNLTQQVAIKCCTWRVVLLQ